MSTNKIFIEIESLIDSSALDKVIKDLEENLKKLKSTATELLKTLNTKDIKKALENTAKFGIVILNAIAISKLIKLLRNSYKNIKTSELDDLISVLEKLIEVFDAIEEVKNKVKTMGIVSDKFFKENDIHIHIPEGAVPKDGPSAGITLATSITSALLGIPVRNDVAMTGEISLRGRVLPIGGLREKLLAARRSGIKKVIMPHDNEKDLKEVPDEVLRDLEIVFVDHVDEVLPQALAATAEEIFSGRATAQPICRTLRPEKHEDDKNQPAQ